MRIASRSVSKSLKVLVIDVGGTKIKILATGKRTSRKVPSGPAMTAREMVKTVQQLAADWSYDAISALHQLRTRLRPSSGTKPEAACSSADFGKRSAGIEYPTGGRRGLRALERPCRLMRRAP